MKSVCYKFNNEGRNIILPPYWDMVLLNWRPFLWVNGVHDVDIHEEVENILKQLNAEIL